MKCKRCHITVPDDAEVCPHCKQDLSSLRQLLTDFYSDAAEMGEEKEPPVKEPEVFPVSEPKVQRSRPDEPRIITEPEPGYGREFSLPEIPDEELEEDWAEREKTSGWDRALRGGFWLRTMALVTDEVILLLLLAVFAVLGLIYLAMGGSAEKVSLLRQIRVIVPALVPLGFVLSLAYFTYFHGTWGQTIGKMIFGLRVVRPDGQPLTFSRALVRTVGYFVSAVPLFLGFFWAGFTSSKRSWHDALADTIVLREQ